MRTTLLLVDDHNAFRRRVRIVRGQGGLAVVGKIKDAASALAATAVLRPAVILLDIPLPDRNGPCRPSERRCP
jgi:DNA-binding NarL/FixJ family response regulator